MNKCYCGKQIKADEIICFDCLALPLPERLERKSADERSAENLSKTFRALGFVQMMTEHYERVKQKHDKW